MLTETGFPRPKKKQQQKAKKNAQLSQTQAAEVHVLIANIIKM